MVGNGNDVKAPEKREEQDSQPLVSRVLASQLSRRTFLYNAGVLTAVATAAPGLLRGLFDRHTDRAWDTAVAASEPDLVRDTFNGLVAFIVPGNDVYSEHQYEQQSEIPPEKDGGIAANVTGVLINSVDLLLPIPSFSGIVADILNGVALNIDPDAPGEDQFQSHFARLSFINKVEVFKVMEGDPGLEALGAFLPFLVALLCYSEAGVFNVETRTVTGQPVGWAISGYDGVADGRDELIGYFQNRRKVKDKDGDNEEDDGEEGGDEDEEREENGADILRQRNRG
jgi:hypothetical protein